MTFDVHQSCTVLVFVDEISQYKSLVDQLADVKELYLNDQGQCRSCLSSDSVVS